jgi:hypothetical protein
MKILIIFNRPPYDGTDGAEKATMAELADWVMESERVISV